MSQIINPQSIPVRWPSEMLKATVVMSMGNIITRYSCVLWPVLLLIWEYVLLSNIFFISGIYVLKEWHIKWNINLSYLISIEVRMYF